MKSPQIARPKHDLQLHLRVTAEEFELFDEAARKDGLSMSVWMRLACRKAAVPRGTESADG